MTTDPRAFVSFDFDHNETEKMLFIGQGRNSRTPFSMQDWSAKAAMPQAQWERLVEEKICRSNMVIVLIGRSMGTAYGVEKEIQMADRNKVPVFGVYVDQANIYSILPNSLARNRVIAWEWDNIASAINQMMGEGKNRSQY